MNGEYVESLRYGLKMEKLVEFDDPPPLERNTSSLRLRLEGDELIVWPKVRYGAPEAAKKVVDEYVRAWEIHEALQSGRATVGFELRSARIVDRTGSEVSEYVVSRFATLRAVRRAPERRNSYPEPPEAFAASPDTEAMWQRYERYLEGREPLLSMAYACLSRLEFAARNAPGKQARKRVERAYGIEEAVLRRLGELTANLGDEAEARKLHAGSQNRPPDDKERTWIEAAVRALIRRSGEHDADPQRTLPQVTMADLPRL